MNDASCCGAPASHPAGTGWGLTRYSHSLLICVTPVTVAPIPTSTFSAWRRMLKAYILYVQQTTPQLSGVRLICKEHLVSGSHSAGRTDAQS